MDMACSISPGVAVPGTISAPLERTYCTVSGLNPGLTINLAPASSARSTCSWVRTVPAPTSISGTSRTIARIASSAAAVRNVTSATGRPPATRAFASGTAFLASSMAITGTMPTLEICFRMGSMRSTFFSANLEPVFLRRAGSPQHGGKTPPGCRGTEVHTGSHTRKTPHPASKPAGMPGRARMRCALSVTGGPFEWPPTGR